MPMANAALLALLGPGTGQEEQTTTANVGAVPVPLGRGELLRPVFPSEPEEPERKKKRKRAEEAELLARAARLLDDLRS